jgi:hypothetical protein
MKALRTWHPAMPVVVVTDVESAPLYRADYEGHEAVEVCGVTAPRLPVGRAAAEHVTSSAVMLRLCIPSALAGRWDYALYLDADVVTVAPLDVLLGLRPAWAAARPLRHPILRHRKWRCAAAPDAGPSRAPRLAGPAFNAGVVLFNVAACASLSLEQWACRAPGNDQAVLNAALDRRWDPIDREWNYPAPLSLDRIPEGVRLLHFQGAVKPWSLAAPQSWRNLWLHLQGGHHGPDAAPSECGLPSEGGVMQWCSAQGGRKALQVHSSPDRPLLAHAQDNTDEGSTLPPATPEKHSAGTGTGTSGLSVA